MGSEISCWILKERSILSIFTFVTKTAFCKRDYQKKFSKKNREKIPKTKIQKDQKLQKGCIGLLYFSEFFCQITAIR